MIIYDRIYRDCLFAGIDLKLENGQVRIHGKPAPELSSQIRAGGRGLAQHLATQSAIQKAMMIDPPVMTQADRYPLSPYQQGFYAESRESGNAGLTQTGIFDLSFAPSREEAERAFNQVLERHPALRNTFSPGPDGRSAQMATHTGWQKIDYYPQDTPQTFETKITEVAKQYNETNFSIEQDRLVKMAIIACKPDSISCLIITFHHIIMDGWSMSLFIEALMEELRTAGITREHLVTEPMFNYGSYSLWVNDHFLPAVRRIQRAYWKRQLSAAPALHGFPEDYTRSPNVEDSGPPERSIAVVSEHLPEKVLESLKRWTAGLGCTLFGALHTALRLSLTLGGTQGNDPLLTVSANRAQTAGVEDLLGAFVNVVPLFAPLNRDLSVAETVLQSHTCLQQALVNQDIPFFSIVDSTAVRRTKDWHPLGQILLLLQNMHGCEGELGAQPRAPRFPFTEYELAFLVWDYGKKGTPVTLEYNRNIYSQSSMHRLLRIFLDLCGTLPSMAETPINKIISRPVIPQGENTLISDSWLASVLFNHQITALHLADQGLDKSGQFSRIAARKDIPMNLGQQGLVMENSLYMTSSWPEALALSKVGHMVGLVNHLPTAALLSEKRDDLTNCTILLSLPDHNGFAAIKTEHIYSMDVHARFISAQVPLHIIPDGVTPGQMFKVGSLELRCTGKDSIEVELPGAWTRYVWRNGHAADLDAFGTPMGNNSVAIGIVAPEALDDPLVNHDGEWVLWMNSHMEPKETDSIIQSLPRPWRPRKKVKLTQLPLLPGGILDRKRLAMIPTVCRGFAQRVAGVLPHRLIPSPHCDKAIEKLIKLYGWRKVFSDELSIAKALPEPGLLFEPYNEFIIPVPPLHEAFAGWSSPFTKSGYCLLDNQAGPQAAGFIHELTKAFPETAFIVFDDPEFASCDRTMTLQVISKTYKEKGIPPAAIIHLLQDTDVNAATFIQEVRNNIQISIPKTMSLCVSFSKYDNFSLAQDCLWKRLARSAVAKTVDPLSHINVCMPSCSASFSTKHQIACLIGAIQSGRANLIAGIKTGEAVSHGVLQGYCFAAEQIEITVQGDLQPTRRYLLSTPGHPMPITFRNQCREDAPTLPRNEMDILFRQVEQIWCTVLALDHSDPNTNFFDLGGSSVLAPVMRDALLKALHLDIGNVGVFRYPTLREMQNGILSILAAQNTDQEHANTRHPARAEHRREKRSTRRRSKKNQRKAQRTESGKTQ